MINSIPNQFRVALNHLLDQEGRGAQVRLSIAQNIDRGYLNAIIKGRKPGAEDIRARIATHFGMTYEEMLTLGRRLLEGRIDLIPELQIPALIESTGSKVGIGKVRVRKDTCSDSGTANSVRKVLEILKSRTGYSDSLSEVIDTYHQALVIDQENRIVTSRLDELEDRVRQMEEALLTKKWARKRDHNQK